jgi:hypothetical protein
MSSFSVVWLDYNQLNRDARTQCQTIFSSIRTRKRSFGNNVTNVESILQIKYASFADKIYPSDVLSESCLPKFVMPVFNSLYIMLLDSQTYRVNIPKFMSSIMEQSLQNC